MNIRDWVEEHGIKNVVCCFSGGRDSLVATHYTYKMLRDANIDIYTVFVDTTIMIPDVYDFVKEVSDRYGWNLIILKPDKAFKEYALEKGMPTMRRRWCCYYLKLRPIREFVKTLRPPVVEILGLRR